MDEMEQSTILGIEKEFRALEEDEKTLHNTELHARIKKAWQMDSPRMWGRLERAGMTDKLAFVVQQRMWAEQDRLIEAGMPYTDAREIAERENLMMEPEEDAGPDQDRAHPVVAYTHQMQRGGEQD
ncbi:hypothetical protein GJ654_12750 [Rhodoblastus acidophilus]|uniref:Uncharacterized protein n=1 Tax=Rhodoblastus acidophilus TaxID=1074 RepID=A0A6N8DQM8_RHOAC|nr:hypothetical protein [Rhodoblastus acidophilus]MCW2275690.1 hypothetical protein [Rhodoblastus acidophilus]MTV31855.1 hypothetical protein [Rhodoblastus acidophilus]